MCSGQVEANTLKVTKIFTSTHVNEVFCEVTGRSEHMLLGLEDRGPFLHGLRFSSMRNDVKTHNPSLKWCPDTSSRCPGEVLTVLRGGWLKDEF